MFGAHTHDWHVYKSGYMPDHAVSHIKDSNQMLQQQLPSSADK